MKIDRRLQRKPCNPRAHELIKFIDAEAAKSGRSLSSICKRAGVDKDLASEWRSVQNANPRLLNVEAVLGALGYELKPVRKGADA